jgi:hypothetical protein
MPSVTHRLPAPPGCVIPEDWQRLKTEPRARVRGPASSAYHSRGGFGIQDGLLKRRQFPFPRNGPGAARLRTFRKPDQMPSPTPAASVLSTASLNRILLGFPGALAPSIA